MQMVDSIKRLSDKTPIIPRSQRLQIDDEHEYLRKQVDPIVMPLIEALLLHQPIHINDFINNFCSIQENTNEIVDPFTNKLLEKDKENNKDKNKNNKKSRLPIHERREQMVHYMEKKILPLMEVLTNQLLKDRPENVIHFIHNMAIENQKNDIEIKKALEKEKIEIQLQKNQIDDSVVSLTISNQLNTNVISTIKKDNILLNFVTILIGMDNAGKSTILSSLQGDQIKEHTPTVGFTSTSFSIINGTCTFYDLGGGPSIRDVWKEYYADTFGIICVVDASSSKEIQNSKKVLHQSLENEHLKGKPLLIYANKQDINGSINNIQEIENYLELYKYKNIYDINIIPCIGKPKYNNNIIDTKLEEGLIWLFNKIEINYSNLSERVQKDINDKKKLYNEKKIEQKKRVNGWKEEKENNEMNKEDIKYINIVKLPSTIEKIKEKNEIINDPMIILCNTCNLNVATTKSGLSKWMPVCNECLNLLKDKISIKK